MNAKHVLLSLLVGLTMSIGAHANSHQMGDLPAGAVTEQNPQKQEFFKNNPTLAMVFRPTENMPEVVKVDQVRAMVASGKPLSDVPQFIGYLPKLKVLPCSNGCAGLAYERAVSAFLEGYAANATHFKERGEMKVRVLGDNRLWTAPQAEVDTRKTSYMQDGKLITLESVPTLRQNLDAETFGISFILEGKLVTLEKKSGAVAGYTTYQLAHELGARLGAELAYTLGMGIKPAYLRMSNEDDSPIASWSYLRKAAAEIYDSVEFIRLQSAGYADNNLLPAIDGILPSEVGHLGMAPF